MNWARTWCRAFPVLAAGWIIAGGSAAATDQPRILAQPPRRMSPSQREELVAAFRRQTEAELLQVRAVARAQGWRMRGLARGRPFEIEAIRDGKVYVDVADNLNAGISTAADQIRAAPFQLSGSGIPIGLWESGGIALSNHQEYVGRVLTIDADSTSAHATHVAGTLVAAGLSNAAAGMAPAATLVSFNSSFDETEMAAAGRADPSETNVIEISNHSYGSTSGWDSGSTPWRWYGLWPASESDNFGIYETQTRAWDVVAYAAPYYLIFKSSGNNRNDEAPTNGQPFAYFDSTWKTSFYDSASHPPADGWDNGGYDTTTPKSNAKNILTVGAVSDAVSGGSRSVAAAAMTAYSGWGPTDDGRIKPDVVGNGQSVYSCDDDHVRDYASMSGTSMSCPNVCGSAALLLQLYRTLFDAYPLSSTLKGLLIHTADDLGNEGPDYAYGWGLVNVRAAAEHLLARHVNPDSPRLVEAALATPETGASHAFIWRSNGAIKATLCWTDPPGPARTGVDNTNRALVNDLDLRLLAPDGRIYFPWVLDPAAPDLPATAGNNFRDNVEQVSIAAPGAAGTWTARVSIAAAITNGIQDYSLLITGHDDSAAPYIRFVASDDLAASPRFQWNSQTGQLYRIRRATNLAETTPFSHVVATVTGSYLSTAYTDTAAAATAPVFYQLDSP